jgi:hypothetical protein
VEPLQYPVLEGLDVDEQPNELVLEAQRQKKLDEGSRRPRASSPLQQEHSNRNQQDALERFWSAATEKLDQGSRRPRPSSPLQQEHSNRNQQNVFERFGAQRQRSSIRVRAVHARRARCNRSVHVAIDSQALQRFGDKMKTPGRSWLAATGKE